MTGTKSHKSSNGRTILCGVYGQFWVADSQVKNVMYAMIESILYRKKKINSVYYGTISRSALYYIKVRLGYGCYLTPIGYIVTDKPLNHKEPKIIAVTENAADLDDFVEEEMEKLGFEKRPYGYYKKDWKPYKKF